MFRPRIIFLLLALITLSAYMPVTRDGFLNLDDDLFVTDNRLVQKGLTLEGVTWAFRTYHASMWHPLTWVSHMLDCELFGLDPRGHHFSNILLHTANTVLLLWLLWKLTGDLWPSALVAALFAWHPLSVESAAWIAERKNVLSTFFGLLTLLCYTGYAQKRPVVQSQVRGSEVSSGAWEYALALFFFALCLMAKTMLVTLPCVMLLLDYWPLRRLAPGLGLRHLLRLALEKLPFFALVVPASVLTFLAESHGGLVAHLERLPLNLRVCSAFRSYALYLWKGIWPVDLAILYPYPPRAHLEFMGALALVFLVAVTLLVLLARRPYPYLLVGWLWFLGTLVPVIGFVQIGVQSMNDHHAYVALIGIYIAAAFGIKDLIARLNIGAVPSTAAAGLVLGSCLVLSERQMSYWRDDETVFKHALAITENNGPARNNLGVALAKRGRQAEAQANFQEAIRLAPLWADPHNNLGNTLRYAGKLEDALREYRIAVRLKPNLPSAHFNLGRVLAELRRFDEALSEFDEAARLDPNYPWPHFQIATILLEQGRDAEAIGQCREALRIAPRDIQILTLTAHVLAAEQDPSLRDGKSALVLALRAAALAADEPQVLDVLGMALAETGDFTSAQTAASRAIQLATLAGKTDLEQWRERLDLYKKHQPWHESFLVTNLPPQHSPTY
ncbi:MAG TPA: tetratricopeptide repeat protein [Verrucomicrobiae bacterium]|nr:tetratricopeptide repeat protein [Verrucomicrobiae bacterium]